MNWNPIQGGVVILLVTLCWVSCDGLASHPGRVVILLVTLCWVSCDGLASHLGGGVVMLPSCFRLQKLESRSGLDEHCGSFIPVHRTHKTKPQL